MLQKVFGNLTMSQKNAVSHCTRFSWSFRQKLNAYFSETSEAQILNIDSETPEVFQDFLCQESFSLV